MRRNRLPSWPAGIRLTRALDLKLDAGPGHRHAPGLGHMPSRCGCSRSPVWAISPGSSRRSWRVATKVPSAGGTSARQARRAAGRGYRRPRSWTSRPSGRSITDALNQSETTSRSRPAIRWNVSGSWCLSAWRSSSIRSSCADVSCGGPLSPLSASTWRTRARCATSLRSTGWPPQAWQLSAVGSPKDGLGEDRQHEPLLAQFWPRRPIERVVLGKPRALQPPPSACEPSAGPVVWVVGTPSHIGTSFEQSPSHGVVRVSAAVTAQATHDRPILWRPDPPELSAGHLDLPLHCLPGRAGCGWSGVYRPGWLAALATWWGRLTPPATRQPSPAASCSSCPARCPGLGRARSSG
jgi:hypothetical protein